VTTTTTDDDINNNDNDNKLTNAINSNNKKVIEINNMESNNIPLLVDQTQLPINQVWIKQG